MQTNQLGKTDLIVSKICFGCWQLSPKFWGEIELGPWHEALKQSIDLGVNFIDTADAYGEGYAEEQLGSYLHREQLHQHFIIATKFYWNFNDPDNRFPDTRYEHILRACEDSLRRLKTDTIDLYQMHAWDAITRPDEVATAIGQLKKQGKIRWFGVSNLNVEQMELYQNYLDIDCLQPPYSLLRRDIESRELPYCLKNKIGVISYSSLFRGLLTGKYEKGYQFSDTRKNHLMYNGKPFDIIMDAINQLKQIASELDLSMAQLAIRWILTHPALSSAIIGVKEPNHLKSIVKSADSQLDQATWHKCSNIMAKARKEAEAVV